MVFTVSTKRYVGDHATIVCHEDGREIPVLHIMAGIVDFPGDEIKLAENIASILNGAAPAHHIDMKGHEVFWAWNNGGAELRILERSH